MPPLEAIKSLCFVQEYGYGYEYEIVENTLQQYKSIEEELGVDLITFFKALKHGFYARGLDYKQHAVSFKKSKNGLYRFTDVDKYHMEYMTWFLTDYGKTWALTKEELL